MSLWALDELRSPKDVISICGGTLIVVVGEWCETRDLTGARYKQHPLVKGIIRNTMQILESEMV